MPKGIGLRADNGFLTSQDPESLIYCLESLAENPHMTTQMALTGRMFVLERFSIDRLVSELTALYRSLLNRSAAPKSVPGERRKKTDSNAVDAV